MNDRELEQKLAQAVACAAPDDFADVLSRLETERGEVISMEEKKRGARRGGALRGLIAACLVLVLAGAGGGFFYHRANAVASVVSLDVNPSIELKVNRSEKVLSCAALNADAAQVLFEMNGGADLKGTKLDVAVNAIVGALLRHGYLEEISSAILISVEDRDQNRAARLQEELTGTVDAALKANAANASILSQVLTEEAAPKYAGFDSGISVGKAALVDQVMRMSGSAAADDAAAFDQLAALSVEELNDLLKTGEKRIPIGKAAAVYAAESYAGTLAVDSVTADVDPELDEVPACYEVELYTALGEFEYIVDAYTGEVLRGRKDIFAAAATPAPAPTGTPAPAATPNPTASASDIGSEAAKAAALKHAGLRESDVTGMKVERDWDDGVLEYEVEFWQGGVEYDCTVDGATGSIRKYERDEHGGSAAATPTSQTLAGEDAAKAAALRHAGCQESDTSYCSSWLEYDDGRAECYKVEFCVGDDTYEYEVGLYDCSILKHERETHHRGHYDHHTAAPTADIGADAAKAAALKHAGLSESDVTGMKVERDVDDGVLEYEVEFRHGRSEYEYTIDGATGTVLKYEID